MPNNRLKQLVDEWGGPTARGYTDEDVNMAIDTLEERVKVLKRALELACNCIGLPYNMLPEDCTPEAFTIAAKAEQEAKVEWLPR